jgi:hypothetical protein
MRQVKLHRRRLIQDHDRTVVETDLTVPGQTGELRGNGFAGATDEGGDIGMSQANIEPDSPAHGHAVLRSEPAKELHQPLGNGQIRQVLGDREGFAALLADELSDVDGERRIASKEAIEVFAARHAQQRLRHTDGDRPSFDLREDHFFAEQRSGAQNRNRHFFSVGRASSDTNHTALDQKDETRVVALLEEHFPAHAHVLNEEVLAICDCFDAGVLEQPRLLQVPDFILGRCLAGGGPVR